MRVNLFFILLSCITYTNSVDILGCGGYVRSEVEINYSQVKIKLLTQQGNFKYETECAPNNGYYFIPLYDKGDYVIQVSPPSGWTFEPEKANLKIDGETDPCSLGHDINFHFKGFAVIGRVVSAGSDRGPVGIDVTLYRGKKIIQKTTTLENGDYSFTPLAAGDYTVKATHPTWVLVKDEVTVSVTDRNGDAGSSLVVAGYTLSGVLAANGKFTPRANFVLHSRNKMTQKLGCNPNKLAGYINALDEPYLCYCGSDEKGQFSFSNLSPGKYSVVPYYQSDQTAYVLSPPLIAITMGHSDKVLDEVIKVKGCSLHGRLALGPNSASIKGANVILNKEHSTVTNNGGDFVFHDVKFGKHSITAVAEGVEFNPLMVTLSMDKPHIGDLIPVKYKMCFSVTVDNIKEESSVWTIYINGKGKGKQFDSSIQTDASGIGCLFLPNGDYSAAIILSPQDEQAGIRFGPKEHLFSVNYDRPSSLSFSQFLGEINGVIECLSSCPTLAVSMRPAKGGLGNPRKIVSTQGKFIFKEIIPGEYLITIDKEEWCWKDQTLSLMVNAKNVCVKFTQMGYRLTLNASHKTTLNYMTTTGQSGHLEVSEGTSRECVSSPGKYAFTPSGCHIFGSSPLTWETSSPHLISLIATHHQVSGVLLSPEPGPFTIAVKSSQNSMIGPLNASVEDKGVYPFTHWATEGESIELTPQSSSNLFQYEPQSFEFVMPGDCLLSAVTFEAERALFLKGYVKPALKGVTITIDGQGDKQTFTTNSDGLFIAGPLDKSKDYTVVAEKIGYILTPPSQKLELLRQKSSEVIKMDFEAYKLAEIIVTIVDEEENPLSGVLVSTSGGKNYRQNSLTEGNGAITFRSLMPGEYFLRPIMKEYTFEPSSRMVTIDEGATINVLISGSRVAYSVFGQTVSLSGDPEIDVVVEVVGTGKSCMDMQEEAMSDDKGVFRIRGLTPKCSYVLRLKEGSRINNHVSHLVPEKRSLTMQENDLNDVRITVMRPFLQMDVAILVHTEPNFLSTLTAVLYRDDNPDSPVYTVSLGEFPFFMLPQLVSDRHSYTLQLRSTLSESQYVYSSPHVSFVASSSFKMLNVEFKPTVKNIEAEISRGTVIGFILFLLLVTLSVNYTKVQPFIEQAATWYATTTTVSSKQSRAINASSPDTPRIEPVDLRKRVKQRKT